MAKNFILKSLSFYYEEEIKKTDDAIFIRIFFTSSRSYKNEIATNNTSDTELKEIILECTMPKIM